MLVPGFDCTRGNSRGLVSTSASSFDWRLDSRRISAHTIDDRDVIRFAAVNECPGCVYIVFAMGIDGYCRSTFPVHTDSYSGFATLRYAYIKDPVTSSLTTIVSKELGVEHTCTYTSPSFTGAVFCHLPSACEITSNHLCISVRHFFEHRSTISCWSLLTQPSSTPSPRPCLRGTRLSIVPQPRRSYRFLGGEASARAFRGWRAIRCVVRAVNVRIIHARLLPEPVCSFHFFLYSLSHPRFTFCDTQPPCSLLYPYAPSHFFSFRFMLRCAGFLARAADVLRDDSASRPWLHLGQLRPLSLCASGAPRREHRHGLGRCLAGSVSKGYGLGRGKYGR